MNKRTLTALRGSIKKWEKIVAGTGIDKGYENCPLCRLFFSVDYFNCTGCPVAAMSGRDNCLGTPYYEYRRAADNWGESTPETIKKQAERELAFLKSLLPKPKRRKA